MMDSAERHATFGSQCSQLGSLTMFRHAAYLPLALQLLGPAILQDCHLLRMLGFHLLHVTANP